MGLIDGWEYRSSMRGWLLGRWVRRTGLRSGMFFFVSSRCLRSRFDPITFSRRLYGERGLMKLLQLDYGPGWHSCSKGRKAWRTTDYIVHFVFFHIRIPLFPLNLSLSLPFRPSLFFTYYVSWVRMANPQQDIKVVKAFESALALLSGP